MKICSCAEATVLKQAAWVQFQPAALFRASYLSFSPGPLLHPLFFFKTGIKFWKERILEKDSLTSLFYLEKTNARLNLCHLQAVDCPGCPPKIFSSPAFWQARTWSVVQLPHDYKMLRRDRNLKSLRNDLFSAERQISVNHSFLLFGVSWWAILSELWELLVFALWSFEKLN